MKFIFGFTVFRNLGDLPTTRYLKGVSIVAEDILWHEITCASGDDVRGKVLNVKQLLLITNMLIDFKHSYLGQ